MNWEQEWIMEQYDLPFLKKGLIIECSGERGKIVGFRNGQLKVKLDTGQTCVYHPTWEIRYLDGDKVIKDFTKNRSKQ